VYPQVDDSSIKTVAAKRAFESVGRSAMSRRLAAMNRRLVAESQIVRRGMQRPKERRGE
jgi:hypothetical protein